MGHEMACNIRRYLLCVSGLSRPRVGIVLARRAFEAPTWVTQVNLDCDRVTGETSVAYSISDIR